MLVSFSHPSSGRWKSSLGSVTVSTSHHRMLVAQKFNLLCKRNPFPRCKKSTWGPGLRFHKFHLIEKNQVFVQWIILLLVKGGRNFYNPLWYISGPEIIHWFIGWGVHHCITSTYLTPNYLEGSRSRAFVKALMGCTTSCLWKFLDGWNCGNG